MEKIGHKVWWLTVAAGVAVIGMGFIHRRLLWLEVIFVPLALLGLWDVRQKRHSILRNYPVTGHMRFLLEGMGPELHQYVVESDQDGRPFNRDMRSVIYQRAKEVEDKKPFGTELDVNQPGYSWLAHSIATRPVVADPVGTLRTTVGGPDCTQPYSASILNISAMSFGALGAPAIRAMNLGAKKGNFAHDTGEGSISPVSPRERRRPDLAAGHRLLRVPDRGRRVRPGSLRRAGHGSAGEDDRDQGLPGRQAGSRRDPARSEGHP